MDEQNVEGHQGADSNYDNLGNITLHVWNRNCVKTSMGYLQLHLGVHSQVGDYHNQYVSGHSQVSDCHNQLLVMTTRGIIWS